MLKSLGCLLLVLCLQEVQCLNTNPYNLRFLLNEEQACQNSSDKFVISVVSSGVDHFKHRQVIRSSWGGSAVHKLNPNFKTVTLFFVGTTLSQKVNDALKFESETYRDIIQADFHDAYRNMTYKFVNELQWVYKYCAGAKYVIKTDDDAFVDIIQVVNYLRVTDSESQNKFVCSILSGTGPFRNAGTKWDVTREEYSEDTYPTYCNGPALILPSSFCGPILDEVSRNKFFWVDDAFVTGVIAKKLKLGFVDLGRMAPMGPYDLKTMKRDAMKGQILLLHNTGMQNALSNTPELWKVVQLREQNNNLNRH